MALRIVKVGRGVVGVDLEGGGGVVAAASL